MRDKCTEKNDIAMSNLFQIRATASNWYKSPLKMPAYGYIKTLNVASNRAVREGILTNNPLTLLPRQERPKRQLDNREFLTIDEIKQLIKTPCRKQKVKNAFLFSVFSGLRFGDVKNLTWDQIQNDNDGQKIIRYTQQKTNKSEYLQLSGEALKFLPEKNDAKDNDIIFQLSNNGYTNETLKSWILAAGITKRVSFNVSRHSHATLLLAQGASIEAVSSLLGHADIKTTQIYAKVIDKNKRAAVSLLDGYPTKVLWDSQEYSLTYDDRGNVIKSIFVDIFEDEVYEEFLKLKYDNNKSPLYHSKTPKWFMFMMFFDEEIGIYNNIIEVNYNGNITKYEYEFDIDGYPIKRIAKSDDEWEEITTFTYITR